jgi:hypothetical protein
MANYQLFVDDSGTREYADDGNYETSGKSLYFVYGAILAEQREASLLVPRLRELKRLTFKTADLEIKSNWLRIPKERTSRYIEPYGVSEQALTQFTDDYFRLLGDAPVELIGSVVNKLHMQEDYLPPRSPWYAPTAAYEFLLQRAVQAATVGGTLSVTIDDIGGSTPKRSPYKRLVAEHHASLRARGSRLQPAISFKALQRDARFVGSQHSDLIQAADLVSYCVHRQFRDHGEAWERPQPGHKLPMYDYFRRLAHKFRTDGDGRIQGFGIVKCPLRNRVVWRRVRNERR